MTTAEQRQQWRELAEAATPGEWFAYWSNQQVATVQISSGWLFQSSDKGTMPDAAFIAAARTAVPALLADVDRLTAERDALAAELAQAREYLEYNQAELRNDEMPLLMDEWLTAQLRRTIEDEHGCTPGEFDSFTLHEGPLFEGMT